MKKLFGLFSKENSVRGASVLLMVTLTLSNLLGLIRDRFLTKNISTFDLDIYYASFRVPDLIFNFLILGAITSAFIPVFSDFVADKKIKDGFKVANSLLNLAVLSMAFSAIVLFVLMPFVVPLIVPKFDQFRLDETIKYSRILMITPVLFSISYIFGGVLNSFKRFAAYSFAPVVYNLSIIFGAAVLAPKYGLIAVVYTVAFGALLHILVQLPAVLRLGFNYEAVLDLKHTSIKRIVRLLVPRTIAMGTAQILLVVFTAIASALAAGSISAFELSNNIQTMPVVVFGTAFATAVFPTLTLKIAEKDKIGFASYFDRAMRSIAFLLIPASVVFIILRAQIVRLILGSGKFSWEDTRTTAMVLGFFSLSLLAQGLIPLFSRAFFALKNTRTPMYVSIFSAATSIVSGFLLARIMGVAGLALAFSIGSFVTAGILYYLLQKIYPEIWNFKVVRAMIKTTVLSLVMGILMWLTMHYVSGLVDMNTFVGVLKQACASLIVAFIVYFGLHYFFRSEEMKWALTRKINGEKPIRE